MQEKSPLPIHSSPLRTSRINALDWMRAIAIIFVIIIHVSDQYGFSGHFTRRRYAILAINSVVRNGLLLFFLMSGFLLIKEYPTVLDKINFYKKRILRIIPLFIGWSFIYYIYSGNSPNIIEFAIKITQGNIFYHLWFIYAIIGIYIVTPYMANIIVSAIATPT